MLIIKNNKIFCRIFMLIALTIGAIHGASPAAAEPKMRLLPRWQAHSLIQTITVDHGPWDAFLKTYVVQGKNGINLVAYGKVTPEDRAKLAAYIATLEKIEVDRLTRDQQAAYWINLYNAATVKLVLEHYPIKSIRDIDISPGLFASGPWGAKVVTVMGEPLSFDDIEHGILRPIWRDPKLHYALNCAALGCPNLMIAAYTADRLKLMLAAAARAYVNHPRGVRATDTGLVLSSLYKWYADDFGGDTDLILSHIYRHADPALKAAIDATPRIISYHYDWRLNDAATETAP